MENNYYCLVEKKILYFGSKKNNIFGSKKSIIFGSKKKDYVWVEKKVLFLGRKKYYFWVENFFIFNVKITYFNTIPVSVLTGASDFVFRVFEFFRYIPHCSVSAFRPPGSFKCSTNNIGPIFDLKKLQINKCFSRIFETSRSVILVASLIYSCAGE